MNPRIHHILSGLNTRSLSSVEVLIVREIGALLALGINEQKSRSSPKSAVHGGIQPLVLSYTDCDFHRMLTSESSESTSAATPAATETTSASGAPAEETPASSEEGKGERSVLGGIIHRLRLCLGTFVPFGRRHLLLLGRNLLLRGTAEASSPSRKGPLTQRSCSISCWHNAHLLIESIILKRAFGSF